MKNLVKREQGFTLIEIVIVMAIAAALILVVLLAVGGAQKSRRDTQRRADATEFVAQLENYAANNAGAYPAAGAAPASFSRNDPTLGTTYTYTATPAVAPTVGKIAYAPAYTCAGPVGVAAAGSTRKYAVVKYLENGGSVCYGN